MGKDLVSDFKDGAGRGLAKTMGKILEEQVGKMQNTVGDAFKGIEGPKLNLTPFWADPGDAAKQVKKMTDGLEEVDQVALDAAAALDALEASFDMTGRAVGSTTGEVSAFIIKMRETEEEWKTIWEAMGDVVGGAFEQAVFEARSAKEVISGVIKDISRLIFRQLVTNQIAGAVTGALGSYFAPAQGAAATYAGYGPQKRFSRGAVFDKPTSFSAAGGGRGLMGESAFLAVPYSTSPPRSRPPVVGVV